MLFEKGYIYHIYNQGNNRKEVFYNRENYLFFLKKVRNYILPYCDILAWCLMPNHFHFMVVVREVSVSSHTMTSSHRMTTEAGEPNSDSMTPSHRITQTPNTSGRTLNTSIAIMLRSYTRAINIEQKLSGSLFRAHTKAECVNCFKGLMPSFIVKDGITQNNQIIPENQYPQVLFNYIHQNPVKAGLVKMATDWEFSSAADYAGLRNGKLVNKKVALQYIDVSNQVVGN